MTYFIDTDALIRLRYTYTPELFKPQWTELHNAISDGRVCSTQFNSYELKVDKEDDSIFYE